MEKTANQFNSEEKFTTNTIDLFSQYIQTRHDLFSEQLEKIKETEEK